MAACDLVISEIMHVRHGDQAEGRKSHVLARKGLSLWIDLDRLPDAHVQSPLFSVGGFNLLSFDERDYGPNFLAKKMVQPLGEYAREIAREILPNVDIVSVKLLTFPRILGASFNPISVYQLSSANGVEAVIYEVRNTFGDMHSYVGVVGHDGGDSVHHVGKKLHVSPFFSMDGGYKLKLRDDGNALSLLIRYHKEQMPLLTATLRGSKATMNTGAILAGFMKTRVFPMRPLLSIHVEALKLWCKRAVFFGRPAPDPAPWTMAVKTPSVSMGNANMSKREDEKIS